MTLIDLNDSLLGIEKIIKYEFEGQLNIISKLRPFYKIF